MKQSIVMVISTKLNYFVKSTALYKSLKVQCVHESAKII